jgi:hypothetical protein
MATTPFSTATVAFAGQSPGKVVDVPAGLRKFYLGLPGNMIQLPPPQVGYTANGSTGESAQGLLSGGMAVMRTPRTKRAYVLNWQRLAGRDWQIVEGFYRRLFGAGRGVSSPRTTGTGSPPRPRSPGLRTATSRSSPPRSGRSPTTRPTPRRSRPPGVVKWAGAGVSSSARRRAGCRRARDPRHCDHDVYGHVSAVPPGEPVTVSMYARTAHLDRVGVVSHRPAGQRHRHRRPSRRRTSP